MVNMVNGEGHSLHSPNIWNSMALNVAVIAHQFTGKLQQLEVGIVFVGFYKISCQISVKWWGIIETPTAGYVQTVIMNSLEAADLLF